MIGHTDGLAPSGATGSSAGPWSEFLPRGSCPTSLRLRFYLNLIFTSISSVSTNFLCFILFYTDPLLSIIVVWLIVVCGRPPRHSS